MEKLDWKTNNTLAKSTGTFISITRALIISYVINKYVLWVNYLWIILYVTYIWIISYVIHQELHTE